MIKHRRHKLMLALAAALVLGLLSTPQRTPPKAAPPTQSTQPAYHYTLRDYNGLLAVYTGDNPEPIQIFEIFTDSLPPQDSARIRAGIGARDEKELQALIEDYTS